MPSLLNLIPNAVSQSPAQIIYAEVASPAPASFADTLYVVMPDWSVKFPFAINDWPAAHGNTLPLVGNAALLITDSRGLLRCVWWDGQMTYATQTSLAYYLTPTASDVGGYLQQLPTPYSPKTTISLGTINNLQVLKNYVTQPNVPALKFIPAGQFEFHIHAIQTAGNQTVQLFAEFWECNASGVNIAMIGQTQNAQPLTSSEIEYRLFFTTANVYTLASTSSRIVCRLKALVGGTGGAVVQLFVGGTADSHVIIPTVTNVPLTTSAWIAPTLINSWANAGGFETAGYLKDPLGFVHLKGVVVTGTTGTVAFVLPAGYRPGALAFSSAAGANGAAITAAAVEISTGGNVTIFFGTAPNGVGLSGITFLAEN